jgi:antitoxin component YwqK of YwqJK toxin-antitoxin module
MEIYHANGELMEQGEIVMGARVDTWKYYNLQGRLYKKEHYNDSGSEIEELL